MEALGEAVDSDDLLGAEHVGAGDGEETDRAAAPDRDGVAGPDVAVFGGLVAGGEDVGEEEDLFVGEVVLDLDGADIGEGHAGVLRLSAGVAAVDVGVAEERGTGVSVHGLGDVGVGVGVVAEAPELALAEETAAAGDGEGDDDAVAPLEVLNGAADLFDDAHELVAEDVAGLHGGDEAGVEVEVAAADGSAGDLDDGVVRVDELRIRYLVDFDGLGAHPTDCFHGSSPWCRVNG